MTTEQIEAWLKEVSGGFLEVLYAGTSILFCVIGIIGAYTFSSIKGRFNPFFIGFPFLLYTANIAGIVYMVFTDTRAKDELIAVIVGCVTNLLFLYPHLVFTMETKAGLLATSTYKSTVAHWCCCCKGGSARKKNNPDDDVVT